VSDCAGDDGVAAAVACEFEGVPLCEVFQYVDVHGDSFLSANPFVGLPRDAIMSTEEFQTVMPVVPLWQSILSIIGGVGGVCGIYALYQNSQQTRLAKEQTQLMKTQAKKADEQEREERHWAERHERMARMLSSINLGLTVAAPNANSQMVLYPAVFQDQQFRIQIETYIVCTNQTVPSSSHENPRPTNFGCKVFVTP
jgi:hypothetical protein